jgi:hypothetical protein
MGEFKPMVKMETTEPSVVLKLKKGGTVAHKPMKGKKDNQKPVKKAMGGGLGAMVPGAPMVASREEMPVARVPMRPSLAQRRKAMAARNSRAMPAGMPPMKKGGMAEFEKSGKDVEKKGVKEGSKADMELDKKQMKSMKKGGKTKCMKTGGVAKGNGGGYKTGGVVNGQGGFKDGGSTGDVKLGNAGGFKKGGATKKFASGGSVDDSGRAQKMPQGNKKASPPVAINMLSGTYKKGGKVKKMADGGMSFDESFASPKEQMAEMRRMKNIEKGEGAISEAEREMANGLGLADKIGSLYNKAKAAIKGPSVTDSKTTVSRTVTPPAKKRGGRC